MEGKDELDETWKITQGCAIRGSVEEPKVFQTPIKYLKRRE